MPGLMRYWQRRFLSRPRRYRNLFRLVHSRRSRTLLEVGTYDGEHARQLIETASLHWPTADVQYFGFDLFEDLTDEVLKKEFSKRPPSQAVVTAKLKATGASVHLSRGYSRDTLPALLFQSDRPAHFDFVLIDGGHAQDTIQADWEVVRSLMGPTTVVVFDDYYDNTESAVANLGCRRLIDGLDRRHFDVQVLDPADRFRKDWGVLRVRMVSVQARA
jgi:methyltransferase family protein